MNKIKSIILVALIFSTSSVFARSVGGGKVLPFLSIPLFQNVTIPLDAGKIAISKEAKENLVNPYDMKVGESASRNILYLVDIGDSSIKSAAEKAGITKIHFVEVVNQSVFIPLLFIPVYVSKHVTKVYGT
jgi:hypothetical protein